jgi:hypothetical protein
MSGLPRYNIFQALDWYTGGAFHPNTEDEKWLALDKRLKEQELTGMQFCHFFIYESKYGGTTAKLNRKNLLCSAEVWREFLSSRPQVIVDTKERIRAQRRQVKEYVQSGFTMEQMLTQRIAPVNSVVRIELALQEKKKDESFDAAKILDKYRGEAIGLLLGVPEYLIYCPELSREVEEGLFSVSEQ